MGSYPQIHTWLTSGGLIPLFPSSVLDLHAIAREHWANLTLWLTDAEPIFSPYNCFPARFSHSLSLAPLDW